MASDEKQATNREHLLALATEIVSAHVSNNDVTVEQLQILIQQVFDALASAEQKATVLSRPEPAVPIRQSVRADHIICLDCGKRLSMLKRHLKTDHQLTPEDYRKRWGLPMFYPMVTPAYAKVRSGLAKKIGLGRRARPAMKKAGPRRKRS
jgi:predicted transcriptional regulator